MKKREIEKTINRIIEGEKLLVAAEELEEKALGIRMQGEKMIEEAKIFCRHPKRYLKPVCDGCPQNSKKRNGNCITRNCGLKNAKECSICKTIVH